MRTTTTRIDQLAAKFNLYRKDQIPAKYWEDEYFKKNAPYKLEGRASEDEVIPPHIVTMKGVESGIFYEVRQQTRENYTTKEVKHELYYIEHSYVLILSPESEILMMYRPNWNKDRKFDLYPYFGELRKYHAMSNGIKHQATKDVFKPNLVGSYTDKKVAAWFIYCIDYVNALDKALESLEDTNAKLIEEREQYIAGMKGATVQRAKDGSTVWINLDGFQITFNHDKQNKYMEKRVEYRGNANDVRTLINKLNP